MKKTVSDQKKNRTEKGGMDEKHLASLLKISQHLASTRKELLDFALNEVVMLSGSQFGYIFDCKETDKELTLCTWSKEVMQASDILDPSAVVALEKTAIFAETVRQRKPIIVNDFQTSDPREQGFPQGLVPIFRLMSLPVFMENRMVAVVGVANKTRGYTPQDPRQLALMMAAIWGIVERKQAEEALRQSQERYRMLVEATFEGIVITENGVIIEANQQFAQMYGYPLQEVYNMQLSDFVVPGEKSRVISVLAGGLEQVGEYQARRKDGSEFLTEAHGRVFKMGQHLARITSIRDISERKQMELELVKHQIHLEELVQQRTQQVQASEERYHSLFENQHTVMLLIDPQNGAIVDVNPAAVTFYGYPRPDFLKMNISDLNTLPASQVKEQMERARTEQRLYFNFRHRLANNELRDVEVYSGPISMEGKQLLFSVIHDRTESKQAEEALKISEEKYRSLFEDAIEGIVQTTPQGKLVNANNAYARIFGYVSAEEMMTDVSDLASQIYANPEDRGRLIELLATTDRVKGFEAQGWRKDGQKIWCSFNVNAIRNPKGKLIRLDSRLMDITERKQAEFALVQKTEDLDHFFNIALDLLCIADTDGYFRRLNRAWETTLGYPISELEGSLFLNYVHPDDMENTLAAMAELSEQNPVINFVNRFRCKDGAYRWIEWRTAPGGKLIYAAARDITERKLTEDTLRANEERLQLATAAGNIGIWDWDVIKNELTWDDNMVSLYNIRHDDWGGTYEAWSAMLHPEDREFTEGEVQAAWRGEREYAPEFRIVRPDGAVRIMKAASHTFRDQNGQVLRMIGTNIDITERKQVETELYNSRQMVQLVLDTIPQRVFWKDHDLVYLGCNQSFAIDAGLKTPAECIGKNDFELPWKENAHIYRADDQLVMDSGKPKLNYEEPQVRAGGSQTWVMTNKVPLYSQSGKVIGIMGTYEDITDRKQADEKVRLANEKLTAMVTTLEKRNLEASLLREMDDMLQVCNLSEEAYAVIQQYVPQLFPSTSGALFLFNNSRRAVEAAAIWGNHIQSDRIFAPDDCWTLRRGQFHQWSPQKAGLRCRHIPPSFSGAYLGVPMLAAGELMGLLHFECADIGWRNPDVDDLARTLTEHLALSLSNIKLREKLHAQSIRDPLTGLYNRRYLEESLERELHRAARSRSQVGIIMLDIDHFKDFNDTYGHETGDAVLHSLGTLLQNQIREEDIACRFGGEEFILILPEASLEVTIQRAEKIRLATKTLVVEYLHKSVGTITLSVGVSIFPTNGSSADDLLRKADKALYQAKHDGRDRIAVSE